MTATVHVCGNWTGDLHWCIFCVAPCRGPSSGVYLFIIRVVLTVSWRDGVVLHDPEAMRCRCATLLLHVLHYRLECRCRCGECDCFYSFYVFILQAQLP